MVQTMRLTATGTRLNRILPRTTNKTEFGGMSLAALDFSADSVIFKRESQISSVHISLAVTHGIEPFQNSALLFDGVPPPNTRPQRPSGRIGISSGASVAAAAFVLAAVISSPLPVRASH